MTKKIKNASGSVKTWVGQEVQPDTYYTIQKSEEQKWAYDDQVLVDIANGVAIVNDGSQDLSGVSNQIGYLQDKLPVEVVTQYEKDDKTLKIASGKGVVDENGDAKVFIKVPGEFGVDKRYISYGMAWFNEKHPDDRVKVFLVDHDNILGYGVDFVIASYTDTDVAEDQQGWYIPYHSGVVEAEALGGYGVIPAAFWMMVVGHKGGESPSGSLYVNLSWGKQEG